MSRPNYLTVEEALGVITGLGIQCSEVRLRRMARERELPFFKDGRRLYIAYADLVAHYEKKRAA